MKGLELPINTLIVIVLAVIVLIAMIALFYSGMLMPQQSISQEVALRNACMKMLNYECKTNSKDIQTVDFDADKDGITDESAADGDNLLYLCVNYYQTSCSSPPTGDADGNCVVGQGDKDFITKYWGATCNPATCPPGNDCWGVYTGCTITGSWNPKADVNGDGTINVFDVGTINANWNKYAPDADIACKKLCDCP